MDAARESRKRRISEASEVLRDGSISPPPKRNASAKNGHVQTHVPTDMTAVEGQVPLRSDKGNVERPKSKVVPSPVQLNFIEELPAISNVNTISLGSILGDPMIKECWLFNYLFDMDFVMKHFDPDTRDLIHVKAVHGSWKRDDLNGIGIEEAAKRYRNIQMIKAYMPEMYGTHHSKMIVLFRHDDLAQVILLTANFIERDWRMSQAIWKTPLLPLQQSIPTSTSSSPLPSLGSGPRFKHDLLAYYRGYGASKLQTLISQLQQYDFSEVRGALIASIPGKHPIHALDIENSPLWGWPALKHILSHIPSTNTLPPTSNPENQKQNHPQIVIQISSIASLPENWLSKTFFPALSTTLPTHIPSPKPKFSIIFPTPSEIRNSLDGYASGSSIHTKISSPAQAKQLITLKPMLCHWGPSDQHQPSPTALTPSSILQAIHGEAPAPQSHPLPLPSIRSAHRAKAAPHIKTYIRFTSPSLNKIDWAMMTSANLSTQAWGASPPPQSGGKIRICSYEIGVVVWPGLWDEGEGAEMVPIFGNDDGEETNVEAEGERENREGEDRKGVRVCWRMPYDLPLVPYRDDETPWSAEVPCREPDRFGRRWMGYGS